MPTIFFNASAKYSNICHENLYDFKDILKDKDRSDFKKRLNALKKLIKPLNLEIKYLAKSPDSFLKELLIVNMNTFDTVGLCCIGSTELSAVDYQINGVCDIESTHPGVFEHKVFSALIFTAKPEELLSTLTYVFKL